MQATEWTCFKTTWTQVAWAKILYFVSGQAGQKFLCLIQAVPDPDWDFYPYFRLDQDCSHAGQDWKFKSVFISNQDLPPPWNYFLGTDLLKTFPYMQVTLLT